EKLVGHLKAVDRVDEVLDRSLVVDHVERAEPLRRRRERVEIEKDRSIRAIDVDRDVIDTERTINVGDQDRAAAAGHGVDLGGVLSARRQKGTRVLARGLRVAIELLGAEIDEPRARK